MLFQRTNSISTNPGKFVIDGTGTGKDSKKNIYPNA